MRHFVHIYHTFRSKFAVDADTQTEAIAKATAMFEKQGDRLSIVGMVTPSMSVETHAGVGEGYLLSEDAEELLGYLVDEVGDDEHANSTSYDMAGNSPRNGGETMQINGVERDTVLAALRLWQRAGGEGTEEWDIATFGGSHAGLDNDTIDALCERLNV